MAITLGAGVVLTGGGIQVGVPLNAPIITDARALSTNSTVISFIPPNNSTGQAVSRYTITSSPGITQNTGTITTATYNYIGLTQGASYTYTINAYSAFDTSLPAIVTLSTWDVPQPPTNLIATVSSVTNASVAFTPPVNFGGTPIFQYRVTSSPGGLTNTGTASPITISGLTTGTSYTFTANATNIVGTSTSSQASTSITAAGVPGAPTGLSASSLGSTSASVDFTAPASNGGSAITSYIAISSPGSISSTATSNPITVSGLTSGTSYTFTVAAINSVGTGATSSASNSVVPGPLVYALATGGTVTTSGIYKVHTFTASNTLVFANGGSVEYLLVGGGGAGGSKYCGFQGGGGGGGAGGVSTGTTTATIQTYTITVGAGATATAKGAGAYGANGANTTAFGLTAYGGGGGGGAVGGVGRNGASGGGGGGGCSAPFGGKGIYPGSTYIDAARQGYDGGRGGSSGFNNYSGGGGGAGSVGTGLEGYSVGTYPNGGIGITSNISGSCVKYAGGGGGNSTDVVGNYNNTFGALYGGGIGGSSWTPSVYSATAGITNTGGGGGGDYRGTSGGAAGGSGIVVVRYQYTA